MKRALAFVIVWIMRIGAASIGFVLTLGVAAAVWADPIGILVTLGLTIALIAAVGVLAFAYGWAKDQL